MHIPLSFVNCTDVQLIRKSVLKKFLTLLEIAADHALRSTINWILLFFMIFICEVLNNLLLSKIFFL